MNTQEFRQYAHELVDWMADYLENVEDYPVLPDVSPGDIIKQIPNSPPEKSDGFDVIFKDFKQKILPGMTHWVVRRFLRSGSAVVVQEIEYSSAIETIPNMIEISDHFLVRHLLDPLMAISGSHLP